MKLKKLNKQAKRGGGGLFFLIVILALGYYFFIYQEGVHNPFNKSTACSGEFQHIITGTADSNGKCCSGLTAEAPQGFVGGAWCVSSNYEIKCTLYNDAEGIYVVEKANSNNHLLLNSMNCSTAS